MGLLACRCGCQTFFHLRRLWASELAGWPLFRTKKGNCGHPDELMDMLRWAQTPWTASQQPAAQMWTLGWLRFLRFNSQRRGKWLKDAKGRMPVNWLRFFPRAFRDFCPNCPCLTKLRFKLQPALCSGLCMHDLRFKWPGQLCKSKSMEHSYKGQHMKRTQHMRTHCTLWWTNVATTFPGLMKLISMLVFRINGHYSALSVAMLAIIFK